MRLVLAICVIILFSCNKGTETDTAETKVLQRKFNAGYHYTVKIDGCYMRILKRDTMLSASAQQMEHGFQGK